MNDPKLAILKSIFGECVRRGKEYMFYCPRCNHHNPKLSVNLDKGIFRCWTCVKKFSGRLRRLIYLYAQEWQRHEWDKVCPEDKQFLFRLPSEEVRIEQRLQLPEEFESLLNPKDVRTADKALKYLSSRGLGFDDVIKWRLGFCSSGHYKGRIIVPSFNRDGYVNFFTGRAFTSEPMCPYLTPPKEEASKNIIFNEINVNWDEPVVLVEGVFDAFVAGDNAIPLNGSSLCENSILFETIVLNECDVLLALDPDAKLKELEIAMKLAEFGIKTFKIDVAPFKDVGSMPKEEFSLRKTNAKQISPKIDMIYGLLERIRP